ncbi:unnamed protein product [Alternaria alternata]
MACGGGCCGPKSTTAAIVKPEVNPGVLTEAATETTSNAIATTQPAVDATLTPSDSEPTASWSAVANPKSYEVRHVEVSVQSVKASSNSQAKHFLLLKFNTCGTKASQRMLSAIGLSEVESI